MQHLDDRVLAALLDGEADRRIDGWADAKQHLADCAECQAHLEALRVIRERAQAILRSGTPSGAQPSFQDVLKRRQAAKAARSLANLRPLAWAATIVVAIGVGWYARELSIRDQVSQGPALLMDDQPRLQASSVDSAPKLAARAAPPITRVPQQLASRPAGVAGEVPARAKEGANVVAERKDEPAPTSVQLAAEPSAQPLIRSTAQAEDQLKKANARDTMPLALDAVVVTAAAPRAAEGAGAPSGERAATRRTRQAPSAPAAATAPPVGRAAADEFAPTSEWTRVDVSAATRALGRPPLTAPGLAIIEYQVGQSGVRVTQRMATGILEIIQQRADARDESLTGPGVGALVEGIQLRLSGPVTYDSLRALVAKLK